MKTKQTKITVIILALAGLLAFSLLATAGDLNPDSPPGSTMHSLEEIYESVAGPGKFEPSSIDRGPSDMYIKFDGIEGEVLEENHDGWSDLVSFSQGHYLPAGELSGATRRRGAVVFEDTTIVKTVDKASPKLAEAVCRGKVFPKVEIHLTASYADAGRVTYYTYEFKNVQISSYNFTYHGQREDPATEVLKNYFEELKVTYTEFDYSGKSKGNVEYTWKIEAAESY